MKLNNSVKQIISIILITAICILFSFVLVWPLWKFATTFSHAYTITILAIIATGLLYLVIRKIKQTPVKKTIKFLISFVLIVVGLFLCIFLLLIGKRFLSILVILVDVILFVTFKIIAKKFIK